MPRLTSNSMSMSLRMLYLSCVKMRELHCPAKTEQKLALGGQCSYMYRSLKCLKVLEFHHCFFKALKSLKNRPFLGKVLKSP